MSTRALFPGTFDPIHLGHIDIATRASRIFDEVIVAVYDKPLKNLLFSPQERFQLACESFATVDNISVRPYSGLTVQYAAQIKTQAIVRGMRVISDFEYEFRMALANKRLDPVIETVTLIANEAHTFLSSSTVKEIASLGGDVSSMVPAHVLRAIKNRFKNEL